MDIDWEKLQARTEKLKEYAEERFEEDEFHLKTKVWTTGNFTIEAKHGIFDTLKEEALLMDEQGNIVYEKREREFEPLTKKILEGKMVHSPEDLSYSDWEKRRMSD